MKKLLNSARLWLLSLLNAVSMEEHERLLSEETEKLTEYYTGQTHVLEVIIRNYANTVCEVCRRSDTQFYDWACEFCKTDCDKHNGWCSRFWPGC